MAGNPLDVSLGNHFLDMTPKGKVSETKMKINGGLHQTKKAIVKQRKQSIK